MDLGKRRRAIAVAGALGLAVAIVGPGLLAPAPANPIPPNEAGVAGTSSATSDGAGVPDGAPILNAAAVAFDVSPALRDIVGSTLPPTREGAVPVDELAAPEGETEGEAEREAEELRERSIPRPSGADPTRPDPLASRGAFRRGATTAAGTSGTATLAAPSVASAWDGLGQGMSGFPIGGQSYAPPDTSMDVSPTQIVEAVNVGLAVWDKATRTKVYGPVGTNALWSGFGGLCQSTNDGDPTVVYDRLAGRWVISQFALSGANGGTVPYLQCVAVSTSGDALGQWYRYAFPYSFFPDYPKLAVWPDAYYTSFNGFSPPSWAFYGGVVCAYDRARMLVGAAATQQCWRNSSYGSLLVAGVEGPTPPAPGTQAYAVALGGSSSLVTWRYSLDWTTPANSRQTGPTSVGVSPYSLACGGGACITQSGTTNLLDSLGDRLMYRYVYRNNATTESLLVAHSVSTSGAAAVRWYELRPSTPGGTPALYQEGTFAPDTTHRWMPSISMDGSGDIGLVYSASSSAMTPAIRVTGRTPGDPLGSLDGVETTVVSSGGSQTGGLQRWGDYAVVAVDPADECTFWAATEYLPASGSFNWRTRIASFAFPNCTGTIGFGVGLARAADQATPTRMSPLRFTLTGSATIQTASVTTGDFTIGNGSASPGDILCSGAACTIRVTPTTDGTVTIAPSPAFRISNTSGDDATTATGTDRSVTYDTTAPSLWLARASSQAANAIASPIVFSLTSGEPLVIASVTTGDFSAAGGTVSSVTCATSTSCAVSVAATTVGTVTIAPSGSFGVTDAAGNVASSVPGGVGDRSVAFNPLPPLANGGFESDLSSWTVSTTPPAAITTSAGTVYAGAKALFLGTTTGFNGDATAGQTFTMSGSATTLRLYFRMVCQDRVQSDWARFTLTDLVNGTSAVVLANYCSKAKTSWQLLTYTIPTALRGRPVRLLLLSHDDGQAADPSYTYVDAISVQ